MVQQFTRWMVIILFSLLGIASATLPAIPTASTLDTLPALPASDLASDAVRDALTSLTPSASPLTSAAVNRATTETQATLPASGLQAASVIRGRTAIVRSTAYNSLVGQTDSNPFITATGTRTRPGVVALSRDLLRLFPYGTRIIIEDLSGRYSRMLAGRVFVVEDTMNARKTNSLDIWMTTRSEAIAWGARQVRITAVR